MTRLSVKAEPPIEGHELYQELLDLRARQDYQTEWLRSENERIRRQISEWTPLKARAAGA